MRRRSLFILAAGASLLQGCSMFPPVVQSGPVIVQLEVWNRTQDDVALLDPAGRIINVPACGHAAPAAIDVSNVEIRMDAGQISTFGSGGVRGPQYLVVVAAAEGGAGSFPTNQRPATLPLCIGHPVAAP